MGTFKTPSGLRANVIVNEWGAAKKPFGLHYSGSEAVDTYHTLFTGEYNADQLQKVLADMGEYGFGFIDDVHCSEYDLQQVADHVYPVTRVVDTVENCLWHADFVRIKIGGVLISHFDKEAITMLYAEQMHTEKYTGFADPEAISHAYNATCEEEVTEPNSESLRRFADILIQDSEDRSAVHHLLGRTHHHVRSFEQGNNTLVHYWLQHFKNRLIVFSNTIVHANDYVQLKVNEQRDCTIRRRMLPSTPLHKIG